jgi:large repetitive protein
MKNYYKTQLAPLFDKIGMQNPLRSLHKIAWAVGIFLWTSAQVMGQVVLDNSAVETIANGITTTTITIPNYSAGSNPNRVMVVAVTTSRRDVTGVQFGTTDLTPFDNGNVSNGNSRVRFFYLVNPPTGPLNLVATVASDSRGFVMGVATYSGVNPTTPFNTFTPATGSGNTAVVPNIPTSAGSMVFSAVSNRTSQDNFLTLGPNQDELWRFRTANSNDRHNSAGSNKIINSGTSTSVSYTHPTRSTNWSAGAVSINPAPSPDLEITKTVNNAQAVVGTNITFTLVARNIGTVGATSVLVEDLLPSGFSYVSSTATKNSYDPNTGEWSLGSMAAASQETLTILATVTCDNNYTNVATISSSDFDQDPSNNVAFSIVEPTSVVKTSYEICFGETFNLTQFNPCNVPSGTNVTWHTDEIATVANKVSTPTAVGGGTYYIAFEDDVNDCYSPTTAFIIVENPEIVVTETITPPSCFEEGSIELAVSGGTAPYTYDWLDLPGTNNPRNRFGLLGGTYEVIITDAKGCTWTFAAPVAFTTPINCSDVNACTNDAMDIFTIDPDPDVTSYTWTLTRTAGTDNANLPIFVSGQGTPVLTIDWNDAAKGIYELCVVANNVCGTSDESCREINLIEPVAIAEADLACDGGTLRLFASGGVSYSWSGPNGFTSSSANPVILNASSVNNGTYTVSVTNSYGCVASASVTVTVEESPILSASVTDANCGQNIGAIDLTVNPTGSYTYLWSNGATTEDVSGLSSGVYSVIVTSAAGCSSTASYAVSETDGPVIAATPSNITCFGGSDGAVNSVSVTGGTAPYTYAWTGPNGFTSSSQNISGLVAGTYNLTVRDANLCTGFYSVNLTQPAPLSLDFTQVNVACNGGTTGSIDLIVSGGTGTYSYSWTTSDGSGLSASDQDQTGLTAGTYEVEVEDANGCTQTATVVISEPAAPLAATFISSDVLCHGGATGQIILTPTGGTAPYTYAWTGPSFTASTKDVAGLLAGDYNVVITDAKGCTFTFATVIEIEQPAAPLAAVGAIEDVTCFGGSNGQVVLTPSGGTTPYTFLWSNGSTDQDLENVAEGTYSVVVTDANGCSVVETFVITEPALLVADITASTNINCFGGTNGDITLDVSGGNGGNTYLWSTLDGTIPSGQEVVQSPSGLTAGTYNVTVTDDEGCTATASVTLTQPTPILVSGSVTDLLCAGGNAGAITLSVSGGAGNYTYAWTTLDGSGLAASSQNQTGLTAGTYTVIVTDDNSCSSASVDFTITSPSPLNLNMTNFDLSCNGSVVNDGAILLSVTGGIAPYTFLWTTADGNIPSGQENEQNPSGLATGTYTVTVTDANSCQAVLVSAPIVEPDLLVVSATLVNNVLCRGDASGSATATPSGGTAPYQYLWSNGSTLQTPADLAAGTASVTVTDARGCTATQTVLIEEPAGNLDVFGIIRNSSACSGNTGAITDVFPVFNAGIVTYSWTGPNSFTSSSADISGLEAGTYTVTATDENLCAITKNFVVGNANALVVSVDAVDKSCVANDGQAYPIITGGVAPYTYEWRNTADLSTLISTNEFILSLDAGTYQVIVTDADGCTATATGTVSEPTNCITPVVSLKSFIVSCEPITGSVADASNTPTADFEYFPLDFPSIDQGILVWGDDYDGSFEFTPTPGFFGTITLEYFAEHVSALSAVGTYTIEVQPCLTYPDVHAGFINKTLTGDVSTNDQLPVGSTYGTTPTLVAGPAGGTPVINMLADGTYTFIADVPGTYIYEVEVCLPAPSTFCTIELLTITLINTAINTNPPVTAPDFAVMEGYTSGSPTTVEIDLRANDFASNSGGLLQEPIIPVQPANGSATIVGGNLVYEPNPGFFGIEEFTYVVCESPSGICITETVIIVVLGDGSDDRVIAADDFNQTTEGVLVEVTNPLEGVLANDYSTADPSSLTASLVGGTLTGPGQTTLTNAFGTLIMEEDGTYSFQPAVGFTGTAAFVYEVCDGLVCVQATLYILVDGGQNPNPDVHVTYTNVEVGGSVATNDAVAPGTTYGTAPASATVPLGANYTLTLNPDGTGEYTFIADKAGEYIFEIEVCGPGQVSPCPTEILTITVLSNTSSQNPPVANPDLAVMTGDDVSPATITINVLANDGPGNVAGTLIGSTTNPEIITASNINGATITVDADGNILYTPAAMFYGEDTFEYTVCETTSGLCATTQVIVYVNPATADLAVIGSDDYQATAQGVTLDVSTVDGVLANDFTTGAGPLTAAIVGAVPDINGQTEVVLPGIGTLTMEEDGSYVFVPDPDFIGTAVIPYSVCDAGTCADATLYILVGDQTTYPDVNATFVNTTVNGDVSTNDQIVAGSTYGTVLGTDLILASSPAGSNPVLTMNADGTYSFVADLAGVYVYEVEVCAPTQSSPCPTEVLTITVLDPTASDNPPVTAPDFAVMDGYNTGDPVTSITLDVRGNDFAGNEGGTLDNPTIATAPLATEGIAVVNGDGTITFTPEPDFYGTVTFTYQVCESPSTECRIETVIIEVLPTNADIKVIAADDYNQTTKGLPVSATAAEGVLANDYTTGDVSNLTASIVGATTQPGVGTLTLSPDGSYTFVPDANFVGTAVFVYEVCEGTVCVQATLYILVGDQTTYPDVNATFVNTTVNGDVSTNDQIVAGSTYGTVLGTDLILASSPAGSNPVLTMNADGTYSFVADLAGVYVYEVEVCAPTQSSPCPTEVLTITVLDPTASDNPPVTAPDFAVMDGYNTGDPVTSITLDVRGNDFAGNEGGTLDNPTIATAPLATEGIAVVNGDGTITFTPEPDFYGTVTFTYQVCESPSTECRIETVIIEVLPTNADIKVIAADDYNQTTKGLPVSATAAEGVLANDYTTGDVSNLTASIVGATTQPGVGTLTLSPDGSYTFVPDANFVGTAVFVYEVCEGTVCVQATLYILVGDQTTYPDVNATFVNTTVNGDVSTNDQIVAGSTYGTVLGTDLILASSPAGSNPVLTMNADGTYSFVADLAGVYVYEVEVCAPTQSSPCPTEVLTITVLDPTASDNPPVTAPDFAVMDGYNTGDPVTSITLDVRGNDFAGNEGGTLDNPTIATAPLATEGIAVVNGDGTITFTPEPDFYGTVTFTYQVCESPSTECRIETVIIEVLPTNADIKVIAADDYNQTTKGLPVSATAAEGVLANDYTTGDVSNLTASIVGATTQPGVGTLTLSPDGSYTFVPDANFVGTAVFVYEVCEGTVCVQATLYILVGDQTTYPDVNATFVNTTVNGDVSTNDQIVAGSTYGTVLGTDLILASSPAGSNPVLTMNADGTYSFVADLAGVYVYEVEVCAPTQSSPCPTEVLTITVLDPTASDNPPVTAPDFAVMDGYNTGDPVTSITLDVRGNDFAGNEGGTLDNPTIATAPLATEGIAVVNGDGTITFTPEPDFYGTVTFTYQVCESPSTECRIETVIIEVLPTNADIKVIAADDYNQTTKGLPVSATAAEGVLANDYTTGDVSNLTASIVGATTQPGVGTLTLSPDGSYTFVPDANFVGTAVFVYEVCEGTVCVQATLYILVGDQTTYPDVNATFVNTTVNGDVSTNDQIVAGSTYGTVLGTDLILASSPAGSNPVLTMNADGTYSFVADLAGVYVYEVEVCAPTQSSPCPTEVLTITVLDPTASDNPPVTAPDFAVMDGYNTGDPVTSITLDVRGNDFAGNEGGTLDNPTIATAPLATEGTAVVNGDGTITFTPEPDFYGTVTFTYQVCESPSTECRIETVIIEVLPANAEIKVIAADDYNQTTKGLPVSATAAEGVLANDYTTGDVSNLTASIVGATTQPGVGTLTLSPDGSYTFVPDANFVGTAVFVYEVCEGTVCVQATLYILVGDQTTYPDVNATFVNTTVNGDVSTNDRVVAGTVYGGVTADLSNPSADLPVLAADGTYSFLTSDPGLYIFEVEVCAPGQTPNENPSECGSEILTITVLDPASTTNPPVTAPDFAVMQGDDVAPATIIINVLGNDLPGNTGGALTGSATNPTVVAASNTNGATITVDANGNIEYTPAAGFYGTDIFNYEVCETPSNICVTEEVRVLVLPDGSDIYVLGADDYGTTTKGATLTVNAAEGVLANDYTTGDATNLTASIVGGIDNGGGETELTQAGVGALTMQADGSYAFVPDANFVGTAVFEYEVCEGTVCAQATLYILVTEGFQVGGTVFNTPGGLTVNGVTDGTPIGTIASAPLYVNYINDDGDVVATTTVDAVDGTWSMVVPGITGAYFQLSENQGTVGNPAPATELPGNWMFIGEGLGTTTDGTPNGEFPITLTQNESAINFGVQEAPISGITDPLNPVVEVLPGGENQLREPIFNMGSFGGTTFDSEAFGAADADGTVTQLRIVDLSMNILSINVNGVEYYRDASEIPTGCSTCQPLGTGVILTANANGEPTVPFSFATVPGYVDSDFPDNTSPLHGPLVVTYQAIDNAGAVSLNSTELIIPVVALKFQDGEWHNGSTENGEPLGSSATAANMPDEDDDEKTLFWIDNDGTLEKSARVKNLQIFEDVVANVGAGVCLSVLENAEAAGTGRLRMQSASDVTYAQYLGPSIRATFEMTMETGFHNIGFPVTLTPADWETEVDTVLGNDFLNINPAEPTRNTLRWYDTRTSGGEEIGFFIDRDDQPNSVNAPKYTSHAYGTWSLPEPNDNLRLRGYNLSMSDFTAPLVDIDMGNPPVSRKAVRIPVTGMSNSDAQTYVTSNNFGGWNLIPNIYPVTISTATMFADKFFDDQVEDTAFFDYAIWIWDGNDPWESPLTGKFSKGAYRAYDVENDMALGAPMDPDNQLFNSEANIAPFQAFYIRRVDASEKRRQNVGGGAPHPYVDPITSVEQPAVAIGELVDPEVTENLLPIVTMKPEYREVCIDKLHYKTQSVADIIQLETIDVDNKLSDVLQVAFADHYTDGLDRGYDVGIMGAPNQATPMTFTIVDGKPLSINKMYWPLAGTSIPMGFSTPFDKHPFVIRMIKDPGSYTVYLEDLKTGVWHDLTSGDYRFTSDHKFAIERFRLHFKLGYAGIGDFHPGIKAWGVQAGIKVEFHNLVSDEARIRITDAAGRVLFNKGNVSTREDFLFGIDGHKLGMYTVTVITEDKVITEKIIR